MKIIVEAEDHMEGKRLVKSLDMSLFIFKLVHHLPGEFKDSEVDHSPVFTAIHDLLDDYGIKIEELIE